MERPRPSGSGYEFELGIAVVHRDGTESTNRVDLFKRDHFLLEAKDAGEQTNESAELRLRRAFGRALSCAAFVPGGPAAVPPGAGRGANAAGVEPVDGQLRRVPGRGAVHRPDAAARAAGRRGVPAGGPGDAGVAGREPSAEVTKEIAGKLASRLEAGGGDTERVARFLIRCVFTMFAEDVGLLDDAPFTAAVGKGLAEEPVAFEGAVQRLWQAMDDGGEFGVNRLLRFNGHFFHDRDVIPLDRDARTRFRKQALDRLRDFHDELRAIRVLDPACGSGNFLYVALSVLKDRARGHPRDRGDHPPEGGRRRGGRPLAVPRHRGQAVGPRGRRALPLGRTPPVVATHPRPHPAPRARTPRHRHPRVPRRRPRLGRDPRGAREGPPGPHAPDRVLRVEAPKAVEW